MKYTEFKNHIFKRLKNEFGFTFVKEEKTYDYSTAEVLIWIETQKSNYGNDAYVYISVSPIDISGWTSPIGVPALPFPPQTIYELDDITFEKIDNDLDDFFKNIFPQLLSIEKLKAYYKHRQKYLLPEVREFWYGKEDNL